MSRIGELEPMRHALYQRLRFELIRLTLHPDQPGGLARLLAVAREGRLLPAQLDAITTIEVVTMAGQPVSVMGFTVSRGKIVEIFVIFVIADPERIARLDLTDLG